MEPHPRKDVPPRRESGEGSEEPQFEPQFEGQIEPEADPAPVYPEGPAAYDPGQAYLDPGVEPVDPNQTYVDPNQAYVDPGQVYVDPGQVYVDPGQAYVDPNQAYADPGQAYVDPNHAYAEPPAGVPAPPPIGNQGGSNPAPPRRTSGPSSRKPKRKIQAKSGRRPASGGSSSRYRRPQPASYGGGVSVMGVFLFLIALAMLAIVGVVLLPKDISSVKGYPVNPLTSEGGEPRNLLDEAQKVMISRDKDLVLSEEEVNRYLNHRLQGQQGGLMSSLVKFRGVYVDFSPERAEIIVERSIFGKPITLTSQIRTEKFQRQTLYRPAGWSIGKLEFTSRNIKPIIDMFFRMRLAFDEEYATLRQMADVRFEENQVVLDATL